MDELRQVLTHIANVSRDEPKPLAALGLKLGEESGELMEAINHHLGWLPHKVMKEPIEGEVADVVQIAVAILVRAYPNLDTEQVLDMLAKMLIVKTAKWQDVIAATS